MARPNPENISKYESLVLAVATGVSTAEWCRRSRTNRSTVAKWQAESKFDQDVQALRRKLLNEAIGKFTGAVCKVADGMILLAEGASSEATKLSAQRSVLEHLVQMTEFAEVKARLDALEARLDESSIRPA